MINGLIKSVSWITIIFDGELSLNFSESPNKKLKKKRLEVLVFSGGGAQRGDRTSTLHESTVQFNGEIALKMLYWMNGKWENLYYHVRILNGDYHFSAIIVLVHLSLSLSLSLALSLALSCSSFFTINFLAGISPENLYASTSSRGFISLLRSHK